MFSEPYLTPKSISTITLEDYGKLQERYQALPLSERAGAVLSDAEPALAAATDILAMLASNPKIKHMIDVVRKNPALMGKIRPSDAKNTLLDASNDFIDVTRKKLAAWRKTMERLSRGEGIIVEQNHQYISSQMPLAVAITSIADVSSYLSMVQLVLSELAKTDEANASLYQSHLVKIRRCSTLLADCENASSFAKVIH